MKSWFIAAGIIMRYEPLRLKFRIDWSVCNFWSSGPLIIYIQNQKEHHKKQTFPDEYIQVLNEFEIEFDNRFIFKSLEIDYTVPDGTL